MRNIYTIIVTLILLSSCKESNVGLTINNEEVQAHKFEFDGNHFIFFEFANRHVDGVTLDPSYIFKGDTINYGGQKYVIVK